ncbi:MAG: hypothetical protein ACOVOV_02395, partial [Dolichospermum sp.]
MKTIQDVQIWINGEIKIAKVLNAFATNVNLDNSANFQYVLFSLNDDETINESINSNNVFMPTEQYLQWDQDEFAWDFVASALNLVITGDYVAPQPIVEEPIVEAAPIEEAAVQ